MAQDQILPTMVQPTEEVAPYTWQVWTPPPVFATRVSRAVSMGFHFLKIVHLNQQASDPFLYQFMTPKRATKQCFDM